MIAFTRNGLVPGEDWRRQDREAIGLAVARGYPAVGTAPGALAFLMALEPATGPDEAVVWSLTDGEAIAVHVALPDRATA